MSSSTSVQDQVRPGECEDIFYYDGETSTKQCFPTTQNTKYVQSFANLTGGSSVFTIPPNSGIQDVVCQFRFAALTSGQAAGLALPRGWCYALIKQVSFRYGGSSQFFLTGDQVLQNALRSQPNRTAANDILTLGGNFTTTGTVPALTSDALGAVVLRLPHSIPTGAGKAHPFPTDLLTQQVQITVELYPVSQIWTNGGVGGSAVPTALASASFQVQQVTLNNAGDSLARRVDMATNAYAFPCEFVQQVQRINLQSSASAQSVVLTGFRSGEVKAIHCWLSLNTDNALVTTTGVYQPFVWYLPSSVVMTYAGDIYARYENATSPLWNLINGNKTPVIDNIYITAGSPPTAANNSASTPTTSSWVELPFAQTLLDDDAHHTLVHGKPITNGIVNLDLVTPTASANWVLNVSYIYNSTLLMSQGTCDYVF